MERRTRIIDGPGEYMTREGAKVIVHTIKGKDPKFCVVGELMRPEGVWEVSTWDKDGHWFNDRESNKDIISKFPKKHTLKVWVNLYPGPDAFFHSSRKSADKAALLSRLACKKVEIGFEKGEGLLDNPW